MHHLTLFSILLFILAFRADARCQIGCTSEEIAKSTPRCYLTNVVAGQSCVVTAHQSLVQRVEKIILVIDIPSVHSYVAVENRLGPGKLEVVIASEHPRIQTLILYGDGIRTTADSLRYVPNLETYTLFSGIFDSLPNFSVRNRQLVNLILHNFTTDGNFNTVYPRYIGGLQFLKNFRFCPANRVFLRDNAFDALPGLQTMILCNLSNVESSFGNTCHGYVNLTEISMHYCDLREVSFLQCLPNPLKLKHINLDFNRIDSIEGLNGFVNLELLGLFENSITSVHRSNFAGLQELTFLNLPGNSIDMIWEDTFRDLHSLESLNLDVNPLLTLSPRVVEFLPNLSQLKLPLLHCDCSLQWLSIVRDTYGLQINPFSICGSPDEFAGLQVYDPDIYTSCTNSFPLTCFDKDLEACGDNSYCRGTSDGSECICEAENSVYSRAHGGKCFNIDEVLEKPAECGGYLHLNGDHDLECGLPDKRPEWN